MRHAILRQPDDERVEPAVGQWRRRREAVDLDTQEHRAAAPADGDGKVGQAGGKDDEERRGMGRPGFETLLEPARIDCPPL